MRRPIRVRIFDADMPRLMRAFENMEIVVARYELPARVTVIDEHLEIVRAGLGDHLPALEVNERVLLTGRELSLDLLLELFKPLHGHVFKKSPLNEGDETDE